MNAMSYILSVIRTYIPEELLIYVSIFDIPEEMHPSVSVDEMIQINVIKNILMRDLNIFSGQRITIDLYGIDIQLDAYNRGVFSIPYERTFGKRITNPMGIGTAMTFFSSGMLGGAANIGRYGSNIQGVRQCGQDNTYVTGQAGRVYGGNISPKVDYNASVKLIGPNTVMCTGLRFFSGEMLVLDTEIEHDDQLNDVDIGAYEVLSEAAVLACKMYISNKIRIALNQGYLSGGQDLGVFKDIVDSYDSAAEDYKTYRKEILGNAMFTADRNKMSNLIKISMTSNF